MYTFMASDGVGYTCEGKDQRMIMEWRLLLVMKSGLIIFIIIIFSCIALNDAIVLFRSLL